MEKGRRWKINIVRENKEDGEIEVSEREERGKEEKNGKEE